MLTVTDKAGNRISEILCDHPADSVVRIVRKGGRMKMRLANARPSDAKFDHNGRTVLVLAQRTSAHLDGGTLDLRDTDRGPKLHIRLRTERRPN